MDDPLIMYNLVCGVVHIKYSLLLTGKSNPYLFTPVAEHWLDLEITQWVNHEVLI